MTFALFYIYVSTYDYLSLKIFISLSIPYMALRPPQWQKKHGREKSSLGSYMFSSLSLSKFCFESKIHSKIFRSLIDFILEVLFCRKLGYLAVNEVKLISTFESGCSFSSFSFHVRKIFALH